MYISVSMFRFYRQQGLEMQRIKTSIGLRP